jgi:hypothetical protein
VLVRGSVGRRRGIGAGLFAALVASLVVGSASPAGACSCATAGDRAALESADVVFTGELIEIRTPPGDSYSSADPERFIFEVDRVYKGDARSAQSVVTPREGGSCGLELVPPGPFLVYATTGPVLDLEGDRGELYSHLCTGSRSLAEAGVPTAFGVGSPPTAGASAIGSLDDGSRPVVPIAIGTALVLALVAGVVLVRRRRRA